MHKRLTAALVFAALAAVAAALVLFTRTPPEAIETTVTPALIAGIAALAGAITGALLAPKFETPFRFFAILTGAVAMMGVQIPFTLLLIAILSFTDPIALGDLPAAIGGIIVLGWGVAAPFQVLTGAIAGWILNTRADPGDPEDES